jgi:predicted Zn-dependent protease
MRYIMKLFALALLVALTAPAPAFADPCSPGQVAGSALPDVEATRHLDAVIKLDGTAEGPPDGFQPELLYVRCVLEPLIEESKLKGRKIKLVYSTTTKVNASSALFNDDSVTLTVYRGLLSKARAPEQLAAILGHEIAHAEFEHGRQDAARKKLLRIGVGGLRPWATPEMVDALVNEAHLPIDRDEETESDERGLELMADAGFDPRTVPQYRWAMGGWRVEDDSESTHPSHHKRLQNMKRLLPEAYRRYLRKLEDRNALKRAAASLGINPALLDPPSCQRPKSL